MEQFPIPILKSVHDTIESARAYVRGRMKDSQLHCRLREASYTVSEIIKLEKKEDVPFWYTLYEGMIGNYIKLRTDCRYLQDENKKLRKENREIKDKYWDAMNRMYPANADSEPL